jgi:hypothetical protein
MPRQTSVDPFTSIQGSSYAEWLRLFSASTSALLQYQWAGLQASLHLADAVGQANRQVFEAWAGAAQQTQRAVRETEEAVSSAADQREQESRPTIKILKRADEVHVGRAAAAKRTNGHRPAREQKPARRTRGAKR